MTPTPEQLIRLSLVRYLLQQAETQAAQPTPLYALAILPAHDALEMFLDVAAEALNAPPAKTPALRDYWDRFKQATPPVELPMQRAIDKLNRCRVALKHHGQRASDDQI